MSEAIRKPIHEPSREAEAALHYHPCPECGKLIDCAKKPEGCEKEIERKLQLYPCVGVRRKQAAAMGGICLHCTQTDIEMATLSDGSPSNCCVECAFEMQMKEKDELVERLAYWHEQRIKEENEGNRRARLKAQTKAQKRHEQVEEAGQEGLWE